MGDYINNQVKTALSGYTNLFRINTSGTGLGPATNTLIFVTDLLSITLPGSEEGFQLGGLPGDSTSPPSGIQIIATGTFAANANVKTINLVLGTTVLATISGAFSGVPWRIDAVVFRVDATDEIANILIYVGNPATVSMFATTATENVDDTIVVKVQGQGVLTGDITENSLTVINI